jgi:sec-independent protein translocase protein TatC
MTTAQVEEEKKANNPNEMSFFEHIDELRSRLIKSSAIWFLIFIACFIFIKPIFRILAEPLSRISETGYVFAAVDIKEPFVANIKAAFWVSIIFSSGIFFYHLWGFVAPGLTRKEKYFAMPFLVFMAFFFVGGCLFGFFYIYPYALKYLMGWNESGLNAYTRTSYLSLLFMFVMGMGASFEMPMVIFFFAKIGLVTPRFLMANFKWAIILIFTLAAIITPTPDPYMQTFLAAPMILLYLLGVGAAYMVTRKDKKERGEAMDEIHELLGESRSVSAEEEDEE